MKEMSTSSQGKAWIVSVDMGYGHQRAATPLAFLAPEGKIITANDYEGMPEFDKFIWGQTKSFYYFVSRLKSHGPIGRIAFNLYDKFQKIEEYYPLRRQNGSTFALRRLFGQIRRGWGRHLIEKLAENPLPLLTPFFSIAFMAEEWKYPGKIYAIVTDSDIARGWAPLEPAKTRIIYLAPTVRTKERLKKYGIPTGNIILTGFPLPMELIGENEETVKHDFRQRLGRLDIRGDYTKQFAPLIESYLKEELFDKPVPRPPALAFVVGGAGAQIEIGVAVLKSLAPSVRAGKILLHLVAGVSADARDEFMRAARELGLEEHLGKTFTVLFADTKDEYFEKFNGLLHSVDVLWTKPSELSFFGAFGIPIIIAPPIGSQEIQNRKWLLYTGAGLDQLSVQFTEQWFFDFLNEGKFAEAAMQGFIKMERKGTEHIARLVARQ